jgi:alpha-L-rhamnosidase
VFEPAQDLRVDGQHRVDTDDGVITPTLALSGRPRFSWARDVGTPSGQAEVELLAGDGKSLGLWVVDEGEYSIESPSDLESYCDYRWRVRCSAGDGWTEWQEQVFESGPLGFEDWRATWLEVPATSRVRSRFTATNTAAARLHLTGQGVILAFLNGVRVNVDRVDPSRTDSSRALYRTYDVTDFVLDGENVVELVAGSGEWHKTGLRPRVLAQVVLRDGDGALAWVAPSVDSEVLPSEMVVDAPFYLERHDVAHESLAADDPTVVSLDTAGDELASPPADVAADGAPPVRAVQPIDVVEIGRVDGIRQFDAGINIAGRSRVTIVSELPAGTVVSVIHGEHLDARGRVDTTNLTMPFDHGRERQVVERVLSGRTGETVEAWFAYHGFRYLEVRGLPDGAVVEVTARTVHTALPVRSKVTTDSPIIGRLMSTALRTAWNNVHGVPEDCPTREQAAWTGDAASASEYHFAQFDNATFVEKWLGDLATSLGPDGALPAVAPDVAAQRLPADPVWGSALHRSLWNHWLNYGDQRIVLRVLPTLRRWAEYQASCIGESGLADCFPISFGHDWLALEQTSPVLMHSGAVVDSFETLAALEAVVGREAEARSWRERAVQLRARMRDEYVDAVTGSVASNSQGSLAVALESGLLTDDEAVDAAAALAALVRARGNRVSTGFALTRAVVRALSRNGYSQVIMDCLNQPAEPGIGAMISSGPGTFWENWWIDPVNTGTGSLDHVGLGAPFAAWVWEHVVGLAPVSHGYSVFDVRPVLVDGITELAASVSTPAGTVSVSYNRSDGALHLALVVPPGARARVTLPGSETTTVGEGEHRFETVAGPLTAAQPPLPSASWTAPSIAPVSADAIDATQLLAPARVRPARGAPTIDTLELACMPVPHGQFDRPVLLVRSTRDGEAPTVLIDLPEPLAVDSATFLYALTDECLASPARDTTQYLAAHFEDGSVLTGTGRVWPAGWNRVTVDVSGATSRLVAVEVGLAFTDAEADNALGVHPETTHAGLHLGEVGLSSKARRW